MVGDDFLRNIAALREGMVSISTPLSKQRGHRFSYRDSDSEPTARATSDADEIELEEALDCRASLRARRHERSSSARPGSAQRSHIDASRFSPYLSRADIQVTECEKWK